MDPGRRGWVPTLVISNCAWPMGPVRMPNLLGGTMPDNLEQRPSYDPDNNPADWSEDTRYKLDTEEILRRVSVAETQIKNAVERMAEYFARHNQVAGHIHRVGDRLDNLDQKLIVLEARQGSGYTEHRERLNTLRDYINRVDEGLSAVQKDLGAQVVQTEELRRYVLNYGPPREQSTNASLQHAPSHDAYVKRVDENVTQLTRGPLKRVWVNKNRLPQFGGTPESAVWYVEVYPKGDQFVRYEARVVRISGDMNSSWTPLSQSGPHASFTTYDDIYMFYPKEVNRWWGPPDYDD